MAEKYLLFSLDDEKSKKLGEIISNPTCKKIVNFLAEQEASVSELAGKLSMPLNTVDYNVKKLVESGIIDKATQWWSVKGKKIDTYRVANKLIVISPKKSNVYSKLKGIVPVVLISGILALFVSWYSRAQNVLQFTSEKAADLVQPTAVSSGAGEAANFVSRTAELASSAAWEWFLVGSLAAIVVFLIWNWKKL